MPTSEPLFPSSANAGLSTHFAPAFSGTAHTAGNGYAVGDQVVVLADVDSEALHSHNLTQDNWFAGGVDVADFDQAATASYETVFEGMAHTAGNGYSVGDRVVMLADVDSQTLKSHNLTQDTWFDNGVDVADFDTEMTVSYAPVFEGTAHTAGSHYAVGEQVVVLADVESQELKGHNLSQNTWFDGGVNVDDFEQAATASYDTVFEGTAHTAGNGYAVGDRVVVMADATSQALSSHNLTQNNWFDGGVNVAHFNTDHSGQVTYDLISSYTIDLSDNQPHGLGDPSNANQIPADATGMSVTIETFTGDNNYDFGTIRLTNDGQSTPSNQENNVSGKPVQRGFTAGNAPTYPGDVAELANTQMVQITQDTLLHVEVYRASI